MSQTIDRTTARTAVVDACVDVLRVDPTAVDEATSFATDLDADSLALVEIVMQLEEQFDLRIPESDLEGVETVGAAVDLVLRHAGAAA